MAETRYYDSLAAEAFCDAGKFVVCGFKLRPFCLLHSAQLEALESPVWTGATDPGIGDLAIAAQICASSKPVVTFSDLAVATEQDWAVWLEYIRVCAARPMLKESVKTAVGSTLNAPLEMLVASYLLRMTTLTEERIWTMPYGLACWYMESIREQETGDSMILTEEESAELDRLNSEEETAKRRKREAIAREIIENTKDAALRYDLLRKCQADELPDNWREELANG